MMSQVYARPLVFAAIFGGAVFAATSDSVFGLIALWLAFLCLALPLRFEADLGEAASDPEALPDADTQLLQIRNRLAGLGPGGGIGPAGGTKAPS